MEFRHPLEHHSSDLEESDFEHEPPTINVKSSKETESTGHYGQTTRAHFQKSLNIEELRPEEVRWFYKENTAKKWTPFNGYDSLRIECKYREKEHTKSKVQNEEACKKSNAEKVCVRGGLYEVCLDEKKCYPIYWISKSKSLCDKLDIIHICVILFFVYFSHRLHN